MDALSKSFVESSMPNVDRFPSKEADRACIKGPDTRRLLASGLKSYSSSDS